MKGHRIVPLGHSAGATATLVFFLLWVIAPLFHFCRILTTKGMLDHELPYVAMILIEPTVVTRELFNAQLDDRMEYMNFVVAMTSARRDIWSSNEHAFEYFKTRFPWKFWDPRVLRLLTVNSPSFDWTVQLDKSFLGTWPRGDAFRRSNSQMR
jgi:hypothetical protein